MHCLPFPSSILSPSGYHAYDYVAKAAPCLREPFFSFKGRRSSQEAEGSDICLATSAESRKARLESRGPGISHVVDTSAALRDGPLSESGLRSGLTKPLQVCHPDGWVLELLSEAVAIGVD